MLQTHEIQLVNIRNLSDSVKEFEFAGLSDTLKHFTPGQFITLVIEHPEGVKRRSYSIVGDGFGDHLLAPKDHIRIAASYVENGIASEYLWQLKPGDTVTAMGPFGRLVLADEIPQKRVILVGTGTGITPYHSMLGTLSEKLKCASLGSVVICQGARLASDLLYDAAFKTFAKTHINAHYISCLSRDLDLPHTGNRTYAHAGYVQSALGLADDTTRISDISALNPETDLIYLCGNPNMIDACFEALKSRDFPIAQIRREKYISTN